MTYFHKIICILGTCRVRDPHYQPWSALNFRSGAYHVHKFPPNPSGASPFYIFGQILPFRSPSFSKSVAEHHRFTFFFSETIIFRTRSIRQRRWLAAGQTASARRVLAVPESRIFTLKTALARSGAPRFQAQNGSNSFRRPSFSRSTGSSFRSPCLFSLCRGTYLPKFGGIILKWCRATNFMEVTECIVVRFFFSI